MSGQSRRFPRGALFRRRTAPRRARRAGARWLANAAGNVAFALLALAVLGVLAGVASCSTGLAPTIGAGMSTGTTTTRDTSTSGNEWISLRSQAPADIIAAARNGPLFQDSQASGGDGGPDLSHLGTPVLVQALRPAGTTADQLPDFFVIPVLNAGGDTTDAVELALNPAHTAVQETAIITYTVPRQEGTISVLTQAQAVQMVMSQQHVAVPAAQQPSLVYFALDPQWQGSQSDQSGWAGGGALPADPIWLVPVAAGGPYLAGDDGTVYRVSQLPQAASQ